MSRIRRSAALPMVCLLVCLPAVGGCGKKIWITQYPAFHTPELKSLLIVPFRNGTRDRAAGLVVTDRFTNAMMANRTYEVFSRSDLKLLADQADVRIASGADTDALATILRKRGRVQAIVTGTVTTYAVAYRRSTKQNPVYKFTPAGKRYLSHYAHTNERVYDATVTATARLIRVADGTTIHATPPVTGRVSSEPSSSAGLKDAFTKGPKSREGCLAAAAEQAVQGLVREFAVVRRQIKVKGDAFLVASELYDNKWRKAKKLRPTDTRAFAVVNFPCECDRNQFVIRIVRKDRREALFSHAFVWQRHWADGVGRGFPFNPSEIAARGGCGEYLAKLYSGPEPVLTAKFKIEPAKD